MRDTGSCTGQDLSGMFSAATRWLEHSAQSINLLNVFPVPDGDTGVNMLLTMRAAMDEATRHADNSASAIAKAMAKGSLMGARGNSGVILSQIFRGLAQGLDGKDTFNGEDLASALEQSSEYAYKAVTKPVEGTILTVVREAAAAAVARSNSNSADVLTILEASVKEARDSVGRTPSLLPVLRQAGVVDAGGQGLYVVLEGALKYLKGEQDDLEAAPAAVTSGIAIPSAQEVHSKTTYGYCTEFLLEGTDLAIEGIRDVLIGMGDSVMVVGDDTSTRVHIHAHDPGAVLSYAVSLGTLRDIKVENMQDQHEDFIALQPELLVSPISSVAVAAGDGLVQAFYSIGATIVVSGGETMNPSVQDLLQAVESAPSAQVVILPNNPNVLLTARQVQSLSEKTIEVIPSKTIPQGIAALLALNYESDLDTNAESMRQALSTVSSGEITKAVRSMEMGGLSIRQGQAIGFLNGKLVIAADTTPEAVVALLRHADTSQYTLLTMYYGSDTDAEEAERLAESIQKEYSSLEIELVPGRQPHYNYIVSLE